MDLKKMKFIACATSCALFLVAIGCASTDGNRDPATFDTGGYESNAHPAAYLTDRFQVNRPLPKHKPSSNAPFFFKSCTIAGDNWPYSNTSYECNYP
jgi:hypothetical protein